MDNNLRETNILFVEIMNSKRQLSKGETWKQIRVGRSLILARNFSVNL